MNQGFFSKKETESPSRPDGKTYSCVSCGLVKECRNPKMKPQGNFQKGIMNIGEFPTHIDDRRNKYWQSKEGKFLQQMYENLGIDIFEDCVNLNAINCSPENENQKFSYQIACCRKTIIKAIEEYKPKLIIVFGLMAMESIIGHRWKKGVGLFTKWRGWTIPDQDLKAWVCPVFPPTEVYEGDKEIETVWKQDLKQAFSKLNTPLRKYIEPNIKVLKSLSALDGLKSGGLVAVDYETTGLKPHAPGHRIISASIASSENDCYTFLMPKSKSKRRPFVKLLKNKYVGKIAQNLKFEHTWSKVRLKTEVKNWVWDTMLASHILDNRSDVTGLKFQTYVRFGIIDYSSEVEPYLRAVDNKNSNSINRIEELIATPDGRHKLLKYGALDSIFEYRLAMIQVEEMNYPLMFL